MPDDPPLKPLLLVAAAALIDAEGRVLICQRPEGKQLAGLWEFPGGKVEAGETPEACLIRELEEELGIEVTHACLAPFVFASHEYEAFHLLMPLYLIRRWTGQITAKEHKAMLEALSKGDEVIAVGILGRIERISDNYLTLEVAPNVNIQVQKQAVTTLLPKGTIKDAK